MNRRDESGSGAFARARRRAVVVAAAITAAACGGSQSAPTAPASTALRADVADPVGDTVSDSRLPLAPDLVHATATVENGSLTVVVSFAPGTFDRQTTRVAVLLDTDQNPATGIRSGTALGADFTLDLFAPNNQATIAKADEAGCAARQSCFVNSGSGTLTVPPDAMQAIVPLSALGNTGGRIAFAVNSYAIVAAQTPVVFDWLPDTNLPPARTQ
jgi:hypothetical protein